jgi:hypothetical protein
MEPTWTSRLNSSQICHRPIRIKLSSDPECSFSRGTSIKLLPGTPATSIDGHRYTYTGLVWGLKATIVPYPGLKCTFKPQNFYVCTVLYVVTDAAILAIPLPMWALQVSFKKKIALMLLLSSGIFVITAAIIRIVMTLVAHPSALTINSWGVRETIAGIIAINIPIIKPSTCCNLFALTHPANVLRSLLKMLLDTKLPSQL